MLEPHPVQSPDGQGDASPVLVDLLVIGGGINGVGIANDAAGRGLSVLLCEQDDLAAHTSSASSKLIHGGLRYLEQYEFRLVREALNEREVLMAKAPHIVWPLRFILPHRPHLRPRWMLRAGLFLYDYLGKRTALSASRNVRLDRSGPLQSGITHAFEYADCWVDDARLVVLNAMQARDHGADIRVRTRCLRAWRDQGVWNVVLQADDGGCQTVQARALVNACGPWVGHMAESLEAGAATHRVRLVQGSHIVVPKLHEGQQAYILQNEDLRIVFVLPYEQHFSLIGTTDLDYRGDPASVSPTAGEEDYLIAVVNAHFKTPLNRSQIIHRFAGVRPLLDDEDDNPAAVTRDYTLSVQGSDQQAPLLSVFGGKLTTYRRLAEAALEKLAPWLADMGPAWTADSALPGGDMSSAQDFRQLLTVEYPWLTQQQIARFARSYGSLCLAFLQGSTGPQDLGEEFGAGLTATEVRYLCTREWAREPEDILWRRSKLGLHLSAAQQQRLADYLGQGAC